jgi:hypothetical protein
MSTDIGTSGKHNADLPLPGSNQATQLMTMHMRIVINCVMIFASSFCGGELRRTRQWHDHNATLLAHYSEICLKKYAIKMNWLH